MTPVGLVEAALERSGCAPRRRGAGLEARCPAHDDSSPSLSVGVGSEGRALVKCHAGCDVDAVLERLQLVPGDLFEAPASRVEIDSTYDYRDEAGELLYQVVRMLPKSFRQRRPDGTGGWVWKLNGAHRVLYRLPEVLAAAGAGGRIFVVEGEKDADRLTAAGEVATCNAGGAGKWRREYGEALRGAGEVVVVADRDEPGYRHARQVRDALVRVVERVIVVQAKMGKDSTDHLAAGHGVEDFEVLSDVELDSACGASSEPERSNVVPRQLRVTRASDIAPVRVSWLWPAWIPASRLVLAGGRPGDGKSSLLTDLAARLSTASPMPDGYRPPAPVNVAILSAEDGVDDTIVPRLHAGGADCERVFIVGGIVDGETGLERPWILPDDMLELRELVRRESVRLLIVDPLSAFQSAKIDAHRDGAVRAMLLPLSNMAEELGCAVVAIRHHRKGGASDARDAGGGSIAYTAAARIEWTIGTDPDDASRRVVAVAKSNIGPVPRSLAYRLVQDEEYETNRLRWDGATDLSANDLMADRVSDEERSAVDEACDVLGQILAGGDVTAKEARRQARDAQIADRTLDRAKKRLGVIARKRDGAWHWSLRQVRHGEDEDRQPTPTGRDGVLGALGESPSTHTHSCEPHSRGSDQGRQGRHSYELADTDRERIW